MTSGLVSGRDALELGAARAVPVSPSRWHLLLVWCFPRALLGQPVRSRPAQRSRSLSLSLGLEGVNCVGHLRPSVSSGSCGRPQVPELPTREVPSCVAFQSADQVPPLTADLEVSVSRCDAHDGRSAGNRDTGRVPRLLLVIHIR